MSTFNTNFQWALPYWDGNETTNRKYLSSHKYKYHNKAFTEIAGSAEKRFYEKRGPVGCVGL
jgi:hypothetical protein